MGDVMNAKASAGEGGGKGARTRALLLETALRMFREQGFEKTTMRGIAAEAGLSLGNAYHYFASKDALIQEFYDDVQRDRRAHATEGLASTRDLGDRLRVVWHAAIDEMAPYHSFAAALLRSAVDPRSPASPFSAESAAVRAESIALFTEVVEGSSAKMDKRLRTALPELLWLADAGVTAYWVFDTSPGQAKTRQLIDGAAPILVRLISLTRLPLVRSWTGEVLDLVDRLRPDPAEASP